MLLQGVARAAAAAWRRQGVPGGPSLQACWAAYATPAASQEEDSIYREAAPVTILADITTVLLGERGRGLIARHSLAAGALVMAVQPAAILYGPPEQPPDPEYLVPALLEAGQQRHAVRAALHCLYDGTDASARQQQLPQLHVLAMQAAPTAGGCCDDPSHHHHHHQHDHHHQQQHSPDGSGSTSTSSSSSSSSSTGGAPPPDQEAAAAAAAAAAPPPLSVERAAHLVRLNAFGDGYEDLAAAAVRGQEAGAASHTGCWPAFALANHSCVPNTVHYVVGPTMVVRAVEDIAAGEEVTVSYLGREDFAPAGARQAVLRERFGFVCDCQRCRLEQQAPQELQQLVEQTYAVVQQELHPAFVQALEVGGSFTDVHSRLIQLEEALNTALQRHLHLLSPSGVLVLQAAVYPLFELLLFCEQLGATSLGESQSEAAHLALARLGRCLAICSCVAKGSELQVYLASRLLHYAVAFRGTGSPQAEAGAALLQQAHLLRYGEALAPELLLQLMEANKQAAEQLLL